ncbi:preprotein translocase subunit SecG [Brevibacillus fulvus]|uniref:Protein-export membrane protein SecG n=1 Tax=Brevibacillus fulvus TaxID=1125967 RepID=A0A939BWU4_9BACL|nr:preprotein translocase subunit SecG [Brevibacillus fulvus]MBM7592141.1 preprotein translocase subunit SecG [Brevibacillus fulvus]
MLLAAKILMVIAAIGLIIVILLQSGKSAGLSGAIGGGAEQLLGKQKARGIDALLGRLTVIFAVLFMVFAVLLGYFL